MSKLVLTGEMVAASGEDTEKCVEFFVSALGSKEAAVSFLEKSIMAIDPLYLRKKRSITDIFDSNVTSTHDPEKLLKTRKISDGTENISYPLEFDILKPIQLNDEMDETLITFSIQVPNAKTTISHMIGKQGENINDIKNQTGVKCMLENTSQPLKDRTVFFLVSRLQLYSST